MDILQEFKMMRFNKIANYYLLNEEKQFGDEIFFIVIAFYEIGDRHESFKILDSKKVFGSDVLKLIYSIKNNGKIDNSQDLEEIEISHENKRLGPLLEAEKFKCLSIYKSDYESNFEVSKSYLLTAIKVYQELEFPLFEVVCYLNLSLLHGRHKYYNKKIIFMRMAEQKLQNLPFSLAHALFYRAKGYEAFSLHKLNLAEEYWVKVLKFSVDEGHIGNIVFVRCYLSTLYFEKGDIRSLQKQIFELENLSQIGFPKTQDFSIRLNHHKADLQFILGNISEALRGYDEILKISKGNIESIGVIAKQLNIYYLSGNFSQINKILSLYELNIINSNNFFDRYRIALLKIMFLCEINKTEEAKSLYDEYKAQPCNLSGSTEMSEVDPVSRTNPQLI